MKKKIIAALMAVMVVAALLIGCGSPKTLQDYVDSPEMQEQIQSLNDQMESMGLTAEMQADGDNLIFVYTYTQETTEEQDKAIAKSLETSFSTSSIESVYTDIIDEIKENVPSATNPTVTLRYLNKSGGEIYSHTYS